MEYLIGDSMPQASCPQAPSFSCERFFFSSRPRLSFLCSLSTLKTIPVSTIRIILRPMRMVSSGTGHRVQRLKTQRSATSGSPFGKVSDQRKSRREHPNSHRLLLPPHLPPNPHPDFQTLRPPHLPPLPLPPTPAICPNIIRKRIRKLRKIRGLRSRGVSGGCFFK